MCFIGLIFFTKAPLRLAHHLFYQIVIINRGGFPGCSKLDFGVNLKFIT